MCGIIGTWPSCDFRLSFLRHRGPDSEGIIRLADVAMGHTRLAILDLSAAGAQPLWSTNGEVLLSYNGEIYNHQTIGVGERSCDTISLSEWLARHGVGADLGLLDGMYAFSAFFTTEKTLMLARDPAGIKPLYIAVDSEGEHLAFSSEIKGLFGVEWFKARPTGDAEVHRAYLQYGSAFPRATVLRLKGRSSVVTLWPTLIEGIFQLCPGQKLTVARDGAVTESFVRLIPQAFEEISALSTSVREQSLADVQVGVQMSGGIDSSLVAYQYACHHPSFHGFYVSVKNTSEYNEDRWAYMAAEVLSRQSEFTFHQIDLTAEVMARVRDDAIWYMDEPMLRHPNAMAVYVLCEYVRQHTKVEVLLTGEGADELFGGYGWHDGITQKSFDETRRLFNLGGDPAWGDMMSLHGEKSIFHRQLQCDRAFYLPPILGRQDRMSMAHSIEARVPFLSNRFLASGLPVMHGKPVLKAEAGRIFGREFAERPKIGFGLPWEWLDKGGVSWELLDWLRVDCQPTNPSQYWVMTALSKWSELYLFDGWKRWKG